MKQNGVRLVQRKFAQGVPIPASSVSVAPAPPERKDPPYPPKNIYHHNMSARNLLDIVSMHNIHKHKQEPLVVLERLRDDEIPSAPVPVANGRRVRPRIRVPLRRRKVKGKGNKGNMCLRSGKRKSTEAGKGPIKKRKKLSSESTDDIPLVYYCNDRPAKPRYGLITDKKVKPSQKRAPTPKKQIEKPTLRAASTDDGSFTFKEPPSPARLSYRLCKKTAATARQIKTGLPKDPRWSTLRSARAPSDTRGIVRRLRNKVLLSTVSGKKPPKPAARKATSETNTDETLLSPPGPSGFRVPRPPPSESSYVPSEQDSLDSYRLSIPPRYNFDESQAGPSGFKPPMPPPTTYESQAGPSGFKPPMPPPTTYESQAGPSGFKPPMPPPTTYESQAGPSGLKSPISSPTKTCAAVVPYYRRDSLESIERFLALKDGLANSSMYSSSISVGGPPMLYVPSPVPSVVPSTDGVEDWCIPPEPPVKPPQSPINESEFSRDMILLLTPPPPPEPTATPPEPTATPPEPTATPQVLLERAIIEPVDTHKGKGVGKKTPKKKQTKGRKPKAAQVKKTLPKRAAKAAPTQEEVAPKKRLLRNSREPPPANPDVYEFDDLEGSRPPSGLRRRNQPTPDPPAQSPESIQYMDILPTSSQLVKINTKKEELGNVLSASLVCKDDIYKKQRNLIDNLANSPALLNKFFNCLPTELQNELGSLATEGNGREEAYLAEKAGTVLEAPTYHPTAEEFEDPIQYYDKIAPEASKYGLCKIVPPDNFKPTCIMSDTIRFAVIYQYISKMYSRWGPVSRELAAIKAHLRTQSVVFARSPLLDGSEVNLPKLYHAVERNGGLSNVIQRKRWGRVADEMKLTKLQHPERKLDPIYMRYLLPYATLSDQERQSIMAEVEQCWTTKYQKMLERARNPFQRQNRMLGTECESESDDEADDGNTAGALLEAEDCIVQGRTMNLVTFKKIATSLMDAHFEPSKQPPGAVDVEKAYWRAVLLGTEHIVANTASIDTGEEGYGFPKDPQVEYGDHPWNLKVLARNLNNVLRYLGPVLGVTVPTLHLNMLFSTSCWHRDPHGLPWTEYMHSGAEKIWYGIPRDESTNFRRAVETLCPAYCQNKSIWLASEITMVPPNILSEHGVKLSRLLQRPGEYVLVFPEAHSCSITTGFGISESVYFASNAWLADVYKLFQELRNSCEPTMFSLEQLLLNGSADPSAPYQVCSVLATLLNAELEHRRALEQKGLKVQERPQSSSAPLNTSYFRAWNTRDQDECEYCRSTLFLSKVTGLTGRKSAVCPEHALRLLETKRHKNVDLHTLEFLSSFTTHALEEMLERLESRTAGEQSAQPDPE